MKLGTLLTVTVLATGITLGAFVDSAEARGSERYSRRSDIPDFAFSLTEQVDLNNDNSSGLFLGAVDDFNYLGFIKEPNGTNVEFSFDGNLTSQLLGNTVKYTVTPNAPFNVFGEVIAPYDVYTFEFNFNGTTLTQTQIKNNYVNSLEWLNSNLPGLPTLIEKEKIILMDTNGDQFELELPSLVNSDNDCFDSIDSNLDEGFCVAKKEIPDPVTTPESSTVNSLLTLAIVSLGILKKIPHNS